MNPFTAYGMKKAFYEAGVAHATLDPRGPGVARLHLVPPKPSFWSNPPSILIINGMLFLPVGPSWAAVLRIFLDELNRKVRVDREISQEEVEEIEGAVVTRVRYFYPRTKKETILRDLREIVTMAISIAQGKPVPPEIGGGMSLRQYARHMTAPHRMDLIVSPMVLNGQRNCPLNCACCYAAGQPVMKIEKELTTTEWKMVIDKCREAHIPMLTFTGGEPLQRRDIAELVKYARWFVTRLNTSGYDLTMEMARALYAADLDSIQITLYSYQAVIHDRLVGKSGAWERTVRGVKNAVEAGLGVSTNTPIVRLNSGYDETLRFLHSLGVRCVTCSGLIPTGGAPHQIQSGGALSSEELYTVLQHAMSVAKELEMEVMFTSPGWLTADQARKLGLTSHPVCGACLSNMAVAPNGDVVPCQSWLKGQTLGNILRDPWNEIWNHDLCKQLRRQDMEGTGCPLKEM